MVALESLIEVVPRGDEARKHVDEVIAITKANSALKKQEIGSMIGARRWLRSESIGMAGRQLAAELGDRRYGDLSPQEFITRCYGVRSKLVHGYGPPVEAVRNIGGSLELFVSHLLAGRDFVDRLYPEAPGGTSVTT